MYVIHAALSAALAAAVVGISVILHNPRRQTNHALAWISLHFTIWLLLVYLQSRAAHPDLLVRINATVSAFFPWSTCLLFLSVGKPASERRRIIKRSLPWLIFAVAAGPLTFTKSFFDADAQIRGLNYIAFNILLLAAFGTVIGVGLRMMRNETGIRKLELEFLNITFAIGSLLSIIFTVSGNILHLLWIKRIGLLVIFGVFAVLARVFTLQRIFDIRQTFTAVFHRIAGITFLITGVIASAPLWQNFVPAPMDLLIAMTLWSSIAFGFDRKVSISFRKLDELWVTKTRNSIILASRTTLQTEDLSNKIVNILRDMFHCDNAILFTKTNSYYISSNIDLSNDRQAIRALCNIGWLTPETIQRRRSRPELEDASALLEKHRLGLVVAVPKESPDPSLIIALGRKVNDTPFTYPEVENLQKVSELIDNILTHSRLTSQAALETKIDHLAMMSRGLAHDLKNLITPLSSFLVCIGPKFSPGSSEFEVYRAANRSVEIMTSYVNEALFFSGKLKLQLQHVTLDSLFTSVAEVTAQKSEEKAVKVAARIGPDRRFAADGVLVQRMLVNLVNNAIDASDIGSSVELTAAIVDENRVQLAVIDHGSGIDPTHLPRIFEPYFTTKRLGDDTRGFGLGLTICQKIVNLHGGTIQVQSTLGKGTTVTVVLPLLAADQGVLPTQPCVALP